jgi:hypothetical protein
VKGRGMALVYGRSVMADFVRSRRCWEIDSEVLG